MPHNAEEEWNRQHPDLKLVVGVAVDGSAIGDKALAVAAAFYREKRADRFVLLHVSDASKTWLPRHLAPRHLENLYVGKAQDLHVHADWACAEKGPGQTTCEALTALAESQAVGLLVVGSIGRKGDKGIEMLGHVTDYSLRESHCSVCIVRSTSPPVASGAGQDYLFATDGSKAAMLAFCTLTKQLLRPSDNVLVSYATYDHGNTKESEEVFAPYRKLMEKQQRCVQVKGECMAWHVPRDKRVSEGILELAAARQANVLVVGISGYGKTKLGSVSEDLSVKAPCSTLVIKDRGDAAGGAANTTFSGAGARTLAGMLAPAAARGAAGSLERKSIPSSDGSRGMSKPDSGIKPAGRQ